MADSIRASDKDILDIQNCLGNISYCAATEKALMAMEDVCGDAKTDSSAV